MIITFILLKFYMHIHNIRFEETMSPILNIWVLFLFQ